LRPWRRDLSWLVRLGVGWRRMARRAGLRVVVLDEALLGCSLVGPALRCEVEDSAGGPGVFGARSEVN
jgi:hypothetical protein